MEIKTKFNKGDTINYLNNMGRPSTGTIIGLTLFTGKKHIDMNGNYQYSELAITYHLEETATPINESDLFATIDELRNSLFEQ